MSAIVPRWEWRTFGDELPEVWQTFGPTTPERVQESDELYVLSMAGTDAVKVRADLMDLKHLVAVDDDGLEQWSPVMKAGFPLSAADVATVLLALGVQAPSLARTEYTLPAFLDEVVGPQPELLAVEVHKRRERFTLGGCMSELTEVRTAQASTHTIAIESEDASAVVETVREVGLSLRPNVSFARGLKVLVRFGRERFAVIDVGTNSVKFHIAERTEEGGWRRLVDRAEPTRLGDGLRDTGRLNPEPMRRTIAAIAAMAEEAKQHRVAAVRTVGTAGFRIASNSEEFLAALRAQTGLQLEVISGEQEGHLAYLAAMAGIGEVDGSRVVFDTGGGSSQFTFGSSGQIDEQFSVEVGAVRYTEQYGLGGVVSSEELDRALQALDRDLSRLDGRPTPDVLVAMGGAVTNLAAVKHELATYDPDSIQGTVLDRAEIERQIRLYSGLTLEERRQVVGLQPQRADIILAGACIVRTVLDKLGKDTLVVSDRALRHGVLEDSFAPVTRAG